MTFQEQWLTWRADKTPRNIPENEFTAWLDDFTSPENDPNAWFAAWRALPGRNDILKQTIRGDILPLGSGPQLLLAAFYALYLAASGKTCCIALSLHIDAVQLRNWAKAFEALGSLSVKLAGTILSFDKAYLADARNADILFIDYFELFSSWHKNPKQFGEIVRNLFIPEIDLALYNTRLLLFERDIERAAGMVYKSAGIIPDAWTQTNDFVDIPKLLDTLTDITLAGCYSLSTPFALEELRTLLGSKAHRTIRVGHSRGTTNLTYRTDAERIAAIVSDVMRTPGHTLLICSTDAIRQELAEEFRKAGQEVTFTAHSVDAVTFFTPNPSEKTRKKIMLLRGLPSAFTLPPAPVAEGQIVLAEYFLSSNMHEKIAAYAAGLFSNPQRPKLYFSLEDQLFTLYDRDGGFRQLFTLIDFTEKYDHWRQIRRVLAGAMAKRLHRLRVKSLDETSPIITMILNTKAAQAPKAARTKSTAKMNAPCFCGSGKPFAQCHGKKLA